MQYELFETDKMILS